MFTPLLAGLDGDGPSNNGLIPEGHRVQAFNRARLQEFDATYRNHNHVQPPLVGGLVSLVSECYRVAGEFRCFSGVQEELDYCLAAYQDKYDAKTLPLIEKGKDIYIGLSSLKARALQGWLQDILVNAEDKPWTLSSTPQPQLPEELERQVVTRLQQELEAGTITPQALVEIIPTIRSIADKHALSIAQSANEGMQNRLYDLMLEGGWRKSYEAAIVDVSIYPAAITRGPVVRLKERMRWKGKKLVQVSEPQVVTERTSPFDMFPSPDSTTPDDGAYIIDRMALSRGNLVAAINTPGFREEAIRRLLVNKPSGTQWWGLHEYTNDEASKQRALLYESGRHEQTYKVLAFYGKVDNSMLIENGVNVGDPHGVTEAEIWVCDKEVLRVDINPRPLGKRPFNVSRFQPIPGSFWGRSLMWIIKDEQRVVNAAARHLVGNMAFSSGPIAEMDHSRMESERDPQNIEPWRVYMTRPDYISQSSAAAIRFHDIPSHSAELQAIVDRYSVIMDDVSGIPAFAIGSPQTSGAGRTLGGLSMLLGNAARGVKRVISSMDKDMIEPLVTSLYYMEMMYGQDESIKVDAQVVARGSSGLLQRQLNQTRAVDLLAVLTPFFGIADGEGNALVPVEGLRRVLFDIVRSMGYTSDEVLPDPDRRERLQILAGGVAPQFQSGQAAPAGPPVGTPPPGLDGRSAPPPDPAAASVLPAP